MNLRRATVSGATALLLLASLTACFAPPTMPGGAGPDDGTASAELAGTTWSGTDSDGDTWDLELQQDGTVAVSFNNGSRFDDATDTWTLTGSTLDIHLVFVESDYDFTGTYDGGSSIPLAGTWTGGEFTLTITQE